MPVREDVIAGEASMPRGEDHAYKAELIEDLVKHEGVETVSLYTNGPFTDLCRGLHAPSTKTVKAYKRAARSRAYWRGDAARLMLTRVYGTASSHEDLEAACSAWRRPRPDHRRLGRDLGLFEFSEVSSGMAFWLPKGTIVWNEPVALTRHMNAERGYVEVKTPQVYDSAVGDLGPLGQVPREHVHHAGRGAADGAQADELPRPSPTCTAMHPHSCTASCRSACRARAPAPLRAVGHAARLCCACATSSRTTPTSSAVIDQILDEVVGCIELAFATHAMFGFDVKLELSTRPEQRIGSDEVWDRAEAALREALDTRELATRINGGDGAFYGPKIDFHLTDSLGRSWQLGTAQLDFNPPERFGLEYAGEDNARHRPAMIHWAIFARSSASSAC
ncbi:MAG: aminoacyl--tRNA ligase-related protein [Solirubrobacteraceae bacterium]